MPIATAMHGAALTQREEEAQLRLDFAAFAQRCFRELNPLTPFAMNWHVEVMAAKLAAVRAGQIRRLIINVPPRYLKSLLGSVAFPAWCLGREPGRQILCVSYAQDLADKLARDCRRSPRRTRPLWSTRCGGPWQFTRRPGEALHPEREPPEMLEQIRRTIGEYNFAGQYQQAPAPLGGGGLVKPAWFRRYLPGELPQSFDRIVQSWDTANKASELSDFSVCTSWGIKGKELYLIDVLRRRLEYPELKRAVREQYERFRPSVVLIEDKASGTQLIQELIREGLYAVTRYKPQSDKVMRMHAQTAMIENGFVRVPEKAPWLAQYLGEMTVFPNGRHDDQVDSTAQMLDWFKDGSGPSSNAGIFELTRRRAEELRRGQMPGPPVRLRAPRGISHVQLFSGIHRAVAADGTVEMTESDAAPLLNAGWVRVDVGSPPE